MVGAASAAGMAAEAGAADPGAQRGAAKRAPAGDVPLVQQPYTMHGMNSRPPGSDHRDGGGASDGRLFRLERFLGFGDPKEPTPAVSILIGLLAVVAIVVISVFLPLRVPHPPPVETRSWIPLIGVMPILLAQVVGDFFYRSNRRLSALLRVGARLVGLPAVAALYAATAYGVYGVRGALFVGGVFFAVMALAALLGRISGPRRSRGPGPP